jgi:hypothetical protein
MEHLHTPLSMPRRAAMAIFPHIGTRIIIPTSITNLTDQFITYISDIIIPGDMFIIGITGITTGRAFAGVTEVGASSRGDRTHIEPGTGRGIPNPAATTGLVLPGGVADAAVAGDEVRAWQPTPAAYP